MLQINITPTQIHIYIKNPDIYKNVYLYVCCYFQMSATARCEERTPVTTTSFGIYFICNFVFLPSRLTHDATSRAGLETCLPPPLQPLIARVNREIKRWKRADMSGLKRGASTAAGKWLAITELLCGWRIVLLLGR